MKSRDYRHPLRTFEPVVLFFLSAVFMTAPAEAQRTVGLLQSAARAYPGYTLFAPMQSRSAFLIDNEGRLIPRWDGQYMPGLAVYLLENGNLIRMCRADASVGEGGGRIEEVDWDGNIVWSVDEDLWGYEFHHDITRMPNGNFLVIAREAKSKQEAIEAGRNPLFFSSDTFLPDVILELKPNAGGSADIQWEWHFWDHMCSNMPGDWKANGRAVGKDIADPHKIDINYAQNGNPDWLHCNSVDYNEALDQIAICAHNHNEILIISHHTADYSDIGAGTEAARGADGDFLYRWGNPETYGGGVVRPRRLFGPHDVQWIAGHLPGAGNLLLYNNGLGRLGDAYSTVEELTPPLIEEGRYLFETGKAYGPDSLSWFYRAPNPTDFYSKNISGAQRLPNGNTLICEGATGKFFEVTQAGDVVWKYVNPANDSGAMQQGIKPSRNAVFNCRRYAADYPGLAGRDLKPGDPIELYGAAVRDISLPAESAAIEVFPNPFKTDAVIRISSVKRLTATLTIFDMLGRKVLNAGDVDMPAGSLTHPLRLDRRPAGPYVLRLDGEGVRSGRIIFLDR